MNSLIQDKYVEVPGEPGEIIIVESDFENGRHPFNGWGNNSSRGVENGVFKVSNPSAVNSWEAQFAYDVQTPFVNGRDYKLKFRVKGSSAGKLSAGFQIIDGYKSAGEFPVVHFDTQWKNVEISCQCNASGATRLIFSFGEFAGDIHIDDFEFTASGVDYKIVDMTPEERYHVDDLNTKINAIMIKRTAATTVDQVKSGINEIIGTIEELLK